MIVQARILESAAELLAHSADADVSTRAICQTGAFARAVRFSMASSFIAYRDF
jgi:hypothetical protein